jgi:hypothetical protein
VHRINTLCIRHNYASIADDIVDAQSLEASFAMKVSPVVPPGM